MEEKTVWSILDADADVLDAPNERWTTAAGGLRFESTSPHRGIKTEQSQFRYALSQLAQDCMTEYKSLPHANVLRLVVKFPIDSVNVSKRLGGKLEESYDPLSAGGNGEE